MDFPEHEDTMKKLDKQPDRFIRLPKLEKELSSKIKQDFMAGLKDQDLKKQLEKELEDTRFRRVLMDYEEDRRKWYRFQNERYTEFLKKWFGEKNIDLVEKSM